VRARGHAPRLHPPIPRVFVFIPPGSARANFSASACLSEDRVSLYPCLIPSLRFASHRRQARYTRSGPRRTWGSSVTRFTKRECVLRCELVVTIAKYPRTERKDFVNLASHQCLQLAIGKYATTNFVVVFATSLLYQSIISNRSYYVESIFWIAFRLVYIELVNDCGISKS